MYGKHKINLLKGQTCLIFHQNQGYFERLVILNQTRINWSFSSIDTIKCLFNCVIYLFIDKRSRVIDMKFYFHLVNYVSVGYLRKTKISKKSCLTIFLRPA